MGYFVPDAFSREDQMTETKFRRIIREEVERAFDLQKLFEDMKDMALQRMPDGGDARTFGEDTPHTDGK